MPRNLVTHCICHKISFEEILEIAERDGLSSLEELRAQNICSTNCKICEPYIQKSLETGITEFEAGFYIT